LQIVLLKSTADKLKQLKVAVFVQHWKVSREMEIAFDSTILQEMTERNAKHQLSATL